MITTPPLRIAFAAVFWRVFLVTFAIQQFTAFHKTRRMLGHSGFARKFAAFLDFSPYALVLALLVAALVTVAFDLIARLVARPLAARWYDRASAASSELPIEFHLNPGERVARTMPARIRRARGWEPGTIVLTDRAVSFYPVSWDLTAWTLPLSAIRDVAVLPSRATLGSFVEGVPGSLAITALSGEIARFALATPDEARACLINGV